MCAFWDKWLKKDDPVRSITHPRQLNTGDMVTVDDSFSLPEGIRGVSLSVAGVSTYQFEHEQSPAWTLKGAEGLIYLAVDEEAGSETITFSKRLLKTQVMEWFDQGEFSRIFEEDYELRLSPLKTESAFAAWIEGKYALKTYALSGYYYESDYRGGKAPEYEGSGEPLDYYCLENEEATHLIEIEVYQDGTTEVSVGQYLPMSAIKDMWPGK